MGSFALGPSRVSIQEVGFFQALYNAGEATPRNSPVPFHGHDASGLGIRVSKAPETQRILKRSKARLKEDYEAFQATSRDRNSLVFSNAAAFQGQYPACAASPSLRPSFGLDARNAWTLALFRLPHGGTPACGRHAKKASTQGKAGSSITACRQTSSSAPVLP